MTKEQFAAQLDGREYPFDLTKDEAAEAKASALVVLFGASDDLAEFRGAINDEAGCYDGGTLLVAKAGLVTPPDEDQIKTLEKFGAAEFVKLQTKAKKIEAVWDEGGISWQYRTDIPHATFQIVEDGEIYCRGIVFSVSDL